MEVHRHLGCGFTEKVYQDALELEMQRQEIPFKRECSLHAMYKGNMLPTTFIPDFICFDNIIVELKAVQELEDFHRSQAFNYAKVAGFDVSLLINFGKRSLEYERYNINKP